MKIISEGSFATEAVESFFVTFFTVKESKSGNPCGFQERYLKFKLLFKNSPKTNSYTFYPFLDTIAPF